MRRSRSLSSHVPRRDGPSHEMGAGVAEQAIDPRPPPGVSYQKPKTPGPFEPGTTRRIYRRGEVMQEVNL
jgi:hypothetical protein